MLLAVFVDVLRSPSLKRPAAPNPAPGDGSGLTHQERLAGLVPVGIVVLLILAAYVMGRPIQRGFGVSGYHSNLALDLSPYFAAVLDHLSRSCYCFSGGAPSRSERQPRLVTIVVIADVLMCVLNGSYTFPAKATLAKRTPP